MSALLLLLTAVQAAADPPPAATVEVPAAPWVAAGPVWVAPLPQCRPCLGDRICACYRRFGLVISGAACFYGRPGIPVSNGPSEAAYLSYFQQPPCPAVSAPVPAPAAGGQK